MKKCTSCGREVTAKYAEFKCPECGKDQIIRCEHCRVIGAKYACSECEFTGP